MKKLTLKLEDLSVESFRTEQAADRNGTVVGHYGANHTLQETCGETCPHSCDVSECGYSCVACDTENDGECSTHCIIPTNVWEPC